MLAAGTDIAGIALAKDSTRHGQARVKSGSAFAAVQHQQVFQTAKFMQGHSSALNLFFVSLSAFWIGTFVIAFFQSVQFKSWNRIHGLKFSCRMVAERAYLCGLLRLKLAQQRFQLLKANLKFGILRLQRFYLLCRVRKLTLACLNLVGEQGKSLVLNLPRDDISK